MSQNGKMRIVVKVGSSSLSKKHGGNDPEKMSLLVDAIAALRNEGHEVVLVSSGAVASGYRLLGYEQRPRTVVAKQAAAAIGQSILMENYSARFATHQYKIAQILLTRDDFSNQERYRHAFQTMSLLLARGITPIINENDTVSVTELTFGDNDMLGALVAGMLHADLYIILTDTDGIYDRDPRNNPEAKRYDMVETITDEIKAVAGGSGSSLGTGGMQSKVIAAETVLKVGTKSFIGRLSNQKSLLQVISGNGEGTYIGCTDPSTLTARKEQVSTQKQWIALHSAIAGRLHVDVGAAHALLHRHSSLLLAGIIGTEGDFHTGDVVEVYGPEGLIGRGVSRMSSEEMRVLLLDNGQEPKTEKPSGEAINRDHWVSLPSFHTQ
ncbi:glutamate 5-kinase [Brevibacillus daliensis]|uniref:glutamate 5-kinase n=1 Tax=Brevibacillus daliensis TaxID=2892995 RepID=UPI001E6142ED|nr:glutamate 5-kinase [Brevibacillus daliensis]